MANALNSLSQNLAANLSELRGRRGMTQAALSKLARVPRSTVTYLESGEGNPSLKNLANVAAALQVTIDELLAPPRASCQLIKAGDLPRRERVKGKVTVYQLLPDPIPGMVIERMEFGVQTELRGVPHVSGTKEYLTCLRGSVSVTVVNETFVVGVGDVLAFPGDRPHLYRNVGGKSAMCISVVAVAPAETR
jgi:transcriptional regulator with XRE-family HTH domain